MPYRSAAAPVKRHAHLSLLLCLLMLLSALLPARASAGQGRVVRVGWYESPFNITGEDGRRSGYAYDYQQKLAAYTGWQFEYVRGTWAELLDMLRAGSIDLLSDVSYTEERAETLHYSARPMGTEQYYIFIPGSGSAIDPTDPATLNGKRVGVVPGSVQEELFRSWAQSNGVRAELVALASDEYASAQQLLRGELDALVTVETLSSVEGVLPAVNIGRSDFYFAVSNSRADLLPALDDAMNRILTGNRNYNSLLYDKYLRVSGAGAYLSAEEAEWLADHGPIRVGYRNDYLPVSSLDKQTDSVTGALKTFMDAASVCLRNATLTFESVAYPSTQAALDALAAGEIDCVFPVSLGSYDSERLDLLTTDTVLESEMYLLVHKDHGEDIFSQDRIRAAVNRGNLNLENFLSDYFPHWERVYCDGTSGCFGAVADDTADGLLVNNYRLSVLADRIDREHLQAISTVRSMAMSFCVSRQALTLYSILNRVIALVPESTVNSALALYSFSNSRVSLLDLIRQNLVPVALSAALILLAFVTLILRSHLVSVRARSAEEAAAQLDEIRWLNNSLEQRQQQLERASEAQQAQIERITALNTELRTAQRSAEEASAAKTSFLFNMSHDIRTPMNAIMGFRDLLEKHQEDPVRRADYLRKIESSSAILLSIINNVLEMARIEKGAVALDESAWSVQQFNDDLFAVFHDLMQRKGLSFTREQHITHPYVYCDPVKLREVFMNLLSNAHKYTLPGGTVHMCLEELPPDREGRAVFRTTVSDTGIGMSEAFLPHVFEEFARERNTTQTGIAGTGLGLPIVKRLITLMGGTIEVTSTKGVGSSFVVTIPHRIADSSALTSYAGTVVDPTRFIGRRILLAEDNDLNAEIATELLSETGFVIDRAEDGAVCVEMLRSAPAGRYDLVLMDIQMPNMNGYEAAQAIRALEDPQKAGIPILAMTANAFEEDRRESFRAGMNAHLAKPIDTDELMRTLSRFLG